MLDVHVRSWYHLYPYLGYRTNLVSNTALWLIRKQLIFERRNSHNTTYCEQVGRMQAILRVRAKVINWQHRHGNHNVNYRDQYVTLRDENPFTQHTFRQTKNFQQNQLVEHSLHRSGFHR
jgi:hypothetical protein